MGLLRVPVVIIACAITSSAARAQEAPTVCPTAVVPARVGSLELVGWEKFPQAELGAVFRYRAVGMFAPDIYVYPADQTPAAEIASFKQGLDVYQKRGEFESFQVEFERELPVAGTQIVGHHVGVMLKKGTQSQRSHFYLFQIAGQSFKVRISYPDGRFTDEAVQRFVDEVTKELTKRSP